MTRNNTPIKNARRSEKSCTHRAFAMPTIPTLATPTMPKPWIP